MKAKSLMGLLALPLLAVSTGAMAQDAAAAAAAVVEKGDVAWMMLSTLLVIMMAIPGLALFYGGLVRTKNMLSVLIPNSETFSAFVDTATQWREITSPSVWPLLGVCSAWFPVSAGASAAGQL